MKVLIIKVFSECDKENWYRNTQIQIAIRAIVTIGLVWVGLSSFKGNIFL